MELPACFPATHQLASMGYDLTPKTGKFGDFFLKFLERKKAEDGIRRNSGGFVEHLIKMAIFVEGNVRLCVSVELQVMILLMGTQ